MFLLFLLYKSNLNESKNIFTNVPENWCLGEAEVHFECLIHLFYRYFLSSRYVLDTALSSRLQWGVGSCPRGAHILPESDRQQTYKQIIWGNNL